MNFFVFLQIMLFLFSFAGCEKKTKPLDVQTKKRESYKEKPLAFDTANIDPSVTKNTPLEVLFIRPNVENVQSVQQITITFNKKMVPLGDFEKLAEDQMFLALAKLCHSSVPTKKCFAAIKLI